MTMCLKGLLIAGLLLSVSLLRVADTADDDPQFWLQRMVDAGQQLSFSGDLVYGQGAELDALRVLRLRDGEEQHERIHSLSGPPREVLREGQKVTRILVDSQLVMVDESDPRRRLTDLTREQINRLDSWYRMRLLGADRIADRPAIRLQLQSRDNQRYGYMLWIDQETGLLLRSQMRDPNDKILEQFMYITIRYGAVDHGAVQATIDHDDFHHHAVGPASTPEAYGTWEATDLPPGFRLLSDGWRDAPNGGKPVRHLMFGDGLASVSVYIAAKVDKPFHGRSRQGSMHVAGRLEGDYQLTVVGDVPSAAVMRVINGLELRP